MTYEPVDIVDLLEREEARLESLAAKTAFTEGQAYGHHRAALTARAWRDALVAELERLEAAAELRHTQGDREWTKYWEGKAEAFRQAAHLVRGER